MKKESHIMIYFHKLIIRYILLRPDFHCLDIGEGGIECSELTPLAAFGVVGAGYGASDYEFLDDVFVACVVQGFGYGG